MTLNKIFPNRNQKHALKRAKLGFLTKFRTDEGSFVYAAAVLFGQHKFLHSRCKIKHISHFGFYSMYFRLDVNLYHKLLFYYYITLNIYTWNIFYRHIYILKNFYLILFYVVICLRDLMAA